jgi:hypothetical protein
MDGDERRMPGAYRRRLVSDIVSHRFIENRTMHFGRK